MNIFILDRDPVQAAKWQCDKHVVKMVTESAQLLCHHFTGAPFRLSNHNTEIPKWVRKSKANWAWLLQHAYALCEEYTERYGKIHGSEEVIRIADEMVFDDPLPDRGLTPFVLAMPRQYYDKDAVIAYRNYYIHDKAYMATWRQNQPPWFKPV